MTLTLVPAEIENYATKHSHPESELFAELARETYAKTEIPQMQVGALEGAFLRLMVRVSGARRILEIGTFTGYSTLAMAEALPEDGEIITCDVEPKTTEMAKKYWARSPHGRKIRSVLAPALDTIGGLSGTFDLVFIDADKPNYKNYWDAVAPKLKTGGVIISDNTLWSGRVLNPASVEDRAIADYNQKIANDRRFETVLATVRDGISISWKKP